MSNLIRAQKNPPFGWYYAWLKLNEYGEPEKDIEAGLKQPETTKVTWDQPDSASQRTARTRDMSANIVPDKGIFGAEYAIIHTIPDFEKKIKARLDSTGPDFVRQLHDLFGQCLQGEASTKWTSVLDRYPIGNRTVDTFKLAIKDYLEKIAEVKNLGDMLIRQLRNNGKPLHMKFNTYIACRNEWTRHLDSGYLAITMARSTAQENVEAIFCQQPKRHQAKYALEKKK